MTNHELKPLLRPAAFVIHGFKAGVPYLQWVFDKEFTFSGGHEEGQGLIRT